MYLTGMRLQLKLYTMEVVVSVVWPLQFIYEIDFFVL